MEFGWPVGMPYCRPLRNGLWEVRSEGALKEIIADQIRQAMKDQGITKTAMAKRMHTDRRQLDRLLDGNNRSMTLSTLHRAANAIGRTLRIELV